MLPTAAVKLMDDAAFLKAYDHLEWENLHAEALLLLIQRYGTDSEISEANEHIMVVNDISDGFDESDPVGQERARLEKVARGYRLQMRRLRA